MLALIQVKDRQTGARFSVPDPSLPFRRRRNPSCEFDRYVAGVLER